MPPPLLGAGGLTEVLTVAILSPEQMRSGHYFLCFFPVQMHRLAVPSGELQERWPHVRKPC